MPMMPMKTARDAMRPAYLRYLNDALPSHVTWLCVKTLDVA